MTYKLLLGAGALLFSYQHPFLLSLGCIIYFLNQSITTQEKQMLKNYVKNGTHWLKNLNTLSKEKGLSTKEGREVVTNITEPLFNNLPTEYLQELSNNTLLQDKVNAFIINEINSKEVDTGEMEWDDYPLEGYFDEMDQDSVDFITYFIPSFDWEQPYTHKVHRQLFKNLKAKFRNPDGSINDELGTKVCTMLEDDIYYSKSFTEQDISNWEDRTPLYEYLFNKQYRN